MTTMRRAGIMTSRGTIASPTSALQSARDTKKRLQTARDQARKTDLLLERTTPKTSTKSLTSRLPGSARGLSSTTFSTKTLPNRAGTAATGTATAARTTTSKRISSTLGSKGSGSSVSRSSLSLPLDRLKSQTTSSARGSRLSAPSVTSRRTERSTKSTIGSTRMPMSARSNLSRPVTSASTVNRRLTTTTTTTTTSRVNSIRPATAAPSPASSRKEKTEWNSSTRLNASRPSTTASGINRQTSLASTPRGSLTARSSKVQTGSRPASTLSAKDSPSSTRSTVSSTENKSRPHIPKLPIQEITISSTSTETQTDRSLMVPMSDNDRVYRQQQQLSNQQQRLQDFSFELDSVTTPRTRQAIEAELDELKASYARRAPSGSGLSARSKIPGSLQRSHSHQANVTLISPRSIDSASLLSITSLAQQMKQMQLDNQDTFIKILNHHETLQVQLKNTQKELKRTREELRELRALYNQSQRAETRITDPPL